MFTTEPNLTRSNIADKEKERIKVFFNSRFNFLNQHNGIRPNNFHLLIAPTHAGKSTITHAIIHTTLEDNPNAKILLYLTEESVEDFETAAGIFLGAVKDVNGRIRIMEESRDEDEDSIMEIIDEAIEIHEPDIVFIDNITTSKIYQDKTTAAQGEVATWLKSLCKRTTMFVIAHTNGNNYNSELLDETHIRGSKTITNIVEFLYVLQPIRLNDRLFQFIRIIKSRRQPTRNKFFYLYYDELRRTITHDIPRSFDEFKEMFKERNKF